jgi:uncharacterized membrane protein
MHMQGMSSVSPSGLVSTTFHSSGFSPVIRRRTMASNPVIVSRAALDYDLSAWNLDVLGPKRHTMLVEVQLTIKAPKEAVWAAITDIENASKIIRGIDKIEVVEKPASGLVGLRWRETRMFFGKPATVEKWITEAAENAFFKTRAEDGGFVFLSTTGIAENSDGSITLTSAHDSQPQTIVGKIMSIPMGLFFKGVAKKAILQDLNDIKSAVEKH